MREELEKGFFGFWVKNFRVSFLFMFLVIIAGIFSLIAIPKESSPDIKFGVIAITTVYQGVNPADIDNLITDEIEKEIKDIDGIKKITSNSSIGVSSITVELFNGVDTRDVLTDIKDKVDSVTLPEDAEDPFVAELSTSNELMFQVLLYGDADRFSQFYLTSKAQALKSELEGKGGIASIDLDSEDDYEINVLLSKYKIETLGISLRDISSQIRSFNKNTPIGNYRIGDLSYDFRFSGEFSSIKDLENLVVRADGNSLIFLKDIAIIEKKYPGDKISSLVFYDQSGYNYISLDFNKKSGSNIFANSASAKLLLEEYIQNNKNAFEGLNIEYARDASEIIKKDYSQLGNTALQTLVLVFITILVFVGFRESMIASILLPLSFLITFTVLDFLGLSLNFLTNFSLVLTLGIAIDTIIVIIEGSSEKSKLGYSNGSAVLLAIRDLKAPLISGTMTTLVAFLPMMFLPGITGKFLSYIPVTVFSTLLGALILSLTISSALFFKISKKVKKYHADPSFEVGLSDKEKLFLQQERGGKQKVTSENLGLRDRMLEVLGDAYFKILHSFLEHSKTRMIAIVSPFLLMILTFVFLSPQIGFTLFPEGDNSVLNLSIRSPVGSDEKVLSEFLLPVEEKIKKINELEFANIDISGNNMSIYLELIDKEDRDKSVFDIEEEILDDISFLSEAGFDVEVAIQGSGPPSGSPVGIKLVASNTSYVSTLKEVANDFEEFLLSLSGTKNVGTSSSDTPGQFVFKFDTDKLSFVGLNPDDIVNELYFYTNGLKSGSIASEYEDNDIILKIDTFEDSVSPSDIENIIISTRIGDVRVGDFARYSFEPGLSSISREDTKITISVESDLMTGVLPTDIQPRLLEFAKNYSYPIGISYSAGGENEENSDLIIATVQSFVIALFLIFSILVFQFNSFSRPAVIIYSVVLALLGVNIGLFLTGNPYSMPFAIGFIALTGVVVNDAIIFVDRMMKNISNIEVSGKELFSKDYIDAISAAGKSRLQPIIVTTLTTVFGVLPLALQDEFWAGLGFTIIFGLLAGSAMTLFIIPALYYQVYVGKKFKRRK